MATMNWNIDELLSMGESIVYECIIEDEDNEKEINVYLTNYRIIWIDGEFVDSRLVKFISKFGVFVGYDEYNEPSDIGTGEYGIYFGDTNGYESLWFYSIDVWKTFYSELSRVVLDDE